VASAASSSIDFPVYFYIATHFPTYPECFADIPNYCSHYAFHMWDLLALCDDYPLILHLSPEDKIFGKILFNRFAEFAASGSVSEWKRFGKYPTNYAVVQVSEQEKIIPNFKKEKCEFWLSNGFEKHWWQN
jgi:hypothetical protein